jgi:inner membrane protein
METENKNYLEKLGQSIKSSVTLKLLSIFILMMLLMIPVTYVKSLIEEREGLRQQAIEEVSGKWAEQQLVFGPVLTIPIQKKVVRDNGIEIIREEAHFLPSTLGINGSVSPETLYRGIYEVVVYNSHLALSGHFNNLSKQYQELDEYELFPEAAFLTIHISDLRGIKEKVLVKWDEEIKEVVPGSAIPSIIPSGITVKHVLGSSENSDHTFSFDLQLQGSQHLGFVPLGKETNAVLRSNWPDPSFAGAFLPDDRAVDKKGFNARWKVLELNRNYPQFWIGDRPVTDLQKSSFGVDLLLPANNYQKSMRSAKYALLAISLTFLTFFLVEVFSRQKVHPFQYILIGLALVLFYTLLMSISEHANFDLAYLVSSIAIIGMIALYAKTILRHTRQTLVLVIILCVTYSFVYITLQVQEYALLIGSIGLTAILAFTMYITRKIDWYDLSSAKVEGKF